MSLRLAAKACVFAAAAAMVAPLALLCWIEKHLARSEWVFGTCAQLLAILPGPFGTYLRGAFYWASLDACSWQTHIGFCSLFTHRHASIAAHVSTGAFCVLGHVRIGAKTRLASRVSIPSGRRQHIDDHGVLVAGTQFHTVTIGEACWIGEAAVVMADIGAHCIVAAGAIVTRSMPLGVLVSGNPATVVRELPVASQASAA